MRLHSYSRCPSKFSPLSDLDCLLGVDVDLLCNDNDTDELGEMVLGNAYITTPLPFPVLKIIITVIQKCLINIFKIL